VIDIEDLDRVYGVDLVAQTPEGNYYVFEAKTHRQSYNAEGIADALLQHLKKRGPLIAGNVTATVASTIPQDDNMEPKTIPQQGGEDRDRRNETVHDTEFVESIVRHLERLERHHVDLFRQLENQIYQLRERFDDRVRQWLDDHDRTIADLRARLDRESEERRSLQAQLLALLSETPEGPVQGGALRCI
jgi:hypothetical protein